MEFRVPTLGFPGVGPNSREGCPSLLFWKHLPKTAWNERIWTGGVPGIPFDLPLRSTWKNGSPPGKAWNFVRPDRLWVTIKTWFIAPITFLPQCWRKWVRAQVRRAVRKWRQNGDRRHRYRDGRGRRAATAKPHLSAWGGTYEVGVALGVNLRIITCKGLIEWAIKDSSIENPLPSRRHPNFWQSTKEQWPKVDLFVIYHFEYKG